jgi:hypothetical protein
MRKINQKRNKMLNKNLEVKITKICLSPSFVKKWEIGDIIEINDKKYIFRGITKKGELSLKNEPQV